VGVTIWDSKEIQAAILGLKIVGKDLRREIIKRSREQILGEWRSTIAENISERGGDIYATRLVMKNTTVKVGTQGFSLNAATRTKKQTSGGLVPADDYYLAEFGANPKVVNVIGRRGGTNYNYKRTVNTGFQRRVGKHNGRYAFKAAGSIINRTIAMYVQTSIQMIYEAFEGKR
jgi:hypothetical protein